METSTPNTTSAFPTSALVSTSQSTPAKILVVEDEPDARTMFVDLLESEGYEVSSAIDGNDALAKAAAYKPNLILLDLVMPNKDGLETLQELKSHPELYANPTVVVLTNISGDAAVEKAMELGAAGFRLKVEMDPEQLIKDVQAFLKGKKQDVEIEPVSNTNIINMPLNSVKSETEINNVDMPLAA
jgi:two-component system alkaline phosphatase synthesis response regulator PhoP